MHWHCFTATNLLNHWLIRRVQLRWQLVSDKQEELMLLTLAPDFGGARAVRKGGKNICVLSPKIWHSLKMWVRRHTHNLPHWKLQISWNQVLFPPAGRGRLCQSQPSTPLPVFQADICPWAEISFGCTRSICDILGSRMYLLLFSMLLILSCLRLFFFSLARRMLYQLQKSRSNLT